jgi:hypothetical protein
MTKTRANYTLENTGWVCGALIASLFAATGTDDALPEHYLSAGSGHFKHD